MYLCSLEKTIKVDFFPNGYKVCQLRFLYLYARLQEKKMRPYNKMEVIIHQNQYPLTAANSVPLLPPVPCTGLALSLLLESYLNKLEEPGSSFIRV